MSDDADVFLGQLEDASERLSSVTSLRMLGRDVTDPGYRAALEAAAKELEAAATAIRCELAEGNDGSTT